MANIDDLLDGPPVTEDVNEAYYINPITRKIEIPADELILGVNHDEKGERKFFRIPKVIGNDVRVMDCDVRIYFQTAASNEQDCYVVKELIEQEDCVVFYWEISSKVTGLPGEVLFSVGITKSIDGVVEKAWNTTCAKATVLDTLHSDLMPGPPAEKLDVIARIEAISDEANAYKEAAQLSAAEAASHAGQAASDADRAFAASVTAAERAADAASAASSAATEAERAAGAASVASSAATEAVQTVQTVQATVESIVPEVARLKEDVAAVTPDDTAVDGKPWTSRKIVDSLCRPFEETGNPVQCYPVDGYPLGVKIQIAPIQEGEGDPSPENVREITGTVAVQIVHSNDAGESNTYDIALPETVYGGTLDLGTGNAEITWAIKTLEIAKFSYNTTINCLLGFNNPLAGIEKPANNTTVAGIKCNKAVSNSASAINGGKSGIGVDINGNIYFRSDGLTSLDDYISAFGDNITVAYKIAEPRTIQLTPRQITALSGVNTIYTDADGVIVTGAEDPKRMIVEPVASTKVNGIAPDETGNIALTATDVGALPSAGGDMTGAINMNGQSISGLNDPTEESQAARKGYVDAAKTEANAYTDAAVRKAAPRNLLDNSDFRNPVNQRGQSNYSLGNWGGYTIDRWAAYDNGVDLALTENGISFSNGIYQRISKDTVAVYNGKKLTFSAKIGDIVYVCSGIITQTGSWHIAAECINGSSTIRMEVENTNDMMFIFENSSAATVEWAALYEGEYTAETLPEYQPKGYGAELAECQRYFIRIGRATSNSHIASGIGNTTTIVNLVLPIPVTMRIWNPSVSVSDGGYSGIFVFAGSSNKKAVTSLTVNASFASCVYLNAISTDITVGQNYQLRLEQKIIDISADL